MNKGLEGIIYDLERRRDTYIDHRGVFSYALADDMAIQAYSNALRLIVALRDQVQERLEDLGADQHQSWQAGDEDEADELRAGRAALRWVLIGESEQEGEQ